MRAIRILSFLERHRGSFLPGRGRVQTRNSRTEHPRGHSSALQASAFVALLLSPMLAWSMTIGGISVQSYLNEPFRAEVTLNNLQKGDLQNLDAKLADEETFGRFGLERSKFLLSLQFKLLADSDPSNARVLISSPQIAREPFFSILIQLQAQRDRLVREFTILLDPRSAAPPDIAASQAVPEEPSLASGPIQVPQQPAPMAPVQPRAKAPASEVIYGGEPIVSRGEYGPVRPGETLWGVAAAVRPSERVTMNQVMWALYSHNESSFAGTIGALQKGSMLKVPTEQVMLDVSPADARALIASVAKTADATLPKPMETQTVAVEPAPEPVTAAVATPAPARDEAPYYAEPEAAETADAQEELIPEPAEPALELVDPADADTAEEPYEQLEALPEADTLEALPIDDLADGELSEEDRAELETLEQLESETAELTVPTATGQAADDNTLMLIIGGGIGLVALIGVWLGLRRKGAAAPKPSPAPVIAAAASSVAAQAAETTADLGEEFDSSEDVPVELTPPPAAATPELAEFDTIEEMPDLDATAQFDLPPGDLGLAEEVGLDDAGLEFDDVPSAPTATSSTELGSLDMPEDIDQIDEAEGTLDLGSETVSLELNEDPLSEADFQLAYGLYDEAAMLLQKAIETAPQRIELHEKLAETYFAANNADAFKTAASALKQLQPADEVWQRITIMGQQLSPGDALYEDDTSGLGMSAGAVDLDMGFDDAGSDELSNLDFDDSTPSPKTENEDRNLVEFTLDDADHNESTIFEANFDDLGAELESETAADGLADLDDLGLDDLEAELAGEDSAAAGGDELADLTLDETESQAAAVASPVDDLGLETDFELDEIATDASDSSMPADSLIPDDSASNLDTPLEFTLDPVAESVTAQTAPELEDELSLDELEPAADATDFDLGEITDLGLEEASSESEQGLAKPPVGESDTFELEDIADEAELTLTESDGESTDFDLSGLEAESTDFELGDLGAEASDFNLEDSHSESTDFDLGEIDTDTGFDLGEETDFDFVDSSLDSAPEDFDLSHADTADIAGGDEAGTKLDLATAYVEMGEADMARNLLEDVIASGNDEQKAQAQELLGRL